VTFPLIVETTSTLNAKLLLSGVKTTSNVVADIPLLSIHWAREFEPIDRIAVAERNRKNIRERRKKDEGVGGTVLVRCGREKRIAPDVPSVLGVGVLLVQRLRRVERWDYRRR
jgi:hypothetical protein